MSTPPPSYLARLRRFTLYGAAAYAMWVLIGVGALLPASCKRPSEPATAGVPGHAAAAPAALSTDCRHCHEDIYQAWAGSHHAHAHRPVDAALDADAFQTAKEFALHGIHYRTAWTQAKPQITEGESGRPTASFTADFVLGYSPLRQYIVPIGGGRYQAAELAFDPGKREWFNVFGDERRQPGEWGHWLGRGMNWNSMCAACHLTEFRKNYDPATDTYASTWREHGIGCLQCHEALAPNHGKTPAAAPRASVAPTPAARHRTQETCAPCHARNEFLTDAIEPGVPYADHFRLTLPIDAGTFYPDGQMRDEDFNYTSFLTSRMGGKAGITCQDCHDPHSGKTRLPAENNLLCLQCHAAPGPLNPPVIDPTAHSHHQAGSAGNQCVSCHMPTTTFMQRDPRHDHGFLKPDPLLTKELSIPNACNRCHADKTTDWALTTTNQWYGAKMESRQRQRTRAVAAAQAEAPGAVASLLTLLASEDLPAWRASYLLLLRPAATDSQVAAAARSALSDTDPLVRSAAVQVLGVRPDAAELLRPLLHDPARLVRLDAEWALSASLPDDSAERRELDAYLAVGADQPSGRMRLGQDLFNRGRVAEAEAPLRQALAWDSNSPALHDILGQVLLALNREAEAAGEFWRAAQLSPNDADLAFRAALAFAGASQTADTELALRETIRRNGRLDRAWYNLGLLLAQTNRPENALDALRTAESLAPNVPDYPYAAATVLYQRGDRAGAIAAAQRALGLDPNYEPALGFLQQATH